MGHAVPGSVVALAPARRRRRSGCVRLLMSFLEAPSGQRRLFLQTALADLTLVFLASEALGSFSSLGLAVSFSFETVWELNLNLINNI